MIIPMKNVERYIAAAIRSVPDVPGRKIEIVCVDDGSTDGTKLAVETLADRRVRVVNNAGRGTAAGRNTGVEASVGEVVLFLDSDDVYVDVGVPAILDALDSTPEASVVFGCHGFIWEDGSPFRFELGLPGKAPINHLLVEGRFFHLAAGAFRRSAISTVGAQRSFFEVCQDVDYLHRIGETVPAWQVPVHVFNARLRDTSASRSTLLGRRDWFAKQAHAFAVERSQRGSDPLMRGEHVAVPDRFPESRRETAASLEAGLLVRQTWIDLKAGRHDEALRGLARLSLRRRYLGLRNLDKAKIAVRLAQRALARAVSRRPGAGGGADAGPT